MEPLNKKDKQLTLPDHFAIAIATAGGAGFVPKLPGTIGSLVGVAIYLLLSSAELRTHYLLLLGVLIPIAILTSGHVEKIYGKDASHITVDEVVGQMLTLGFVTREGFSLVTGAILGFLLFRFFDILKPFPVRYLEGLPKGIGVVADDLGAGIYALLTLTILEYAIGNSF